HALVRVLDAADRRGLMLGEAFSEASRAKIRQLVDMARRAAEAGDQPEADRIAALGLLARTSSAAWASVFEARQADADLFSRLAAASQPPAVQLAAVQAIARSAGEQASGRLLTCWASATPRLRGEILDLLLTREEWSNALLEALEQGRVQLNELDAARRQRLL